MVLRGPEGAHRGPLRAGFFRAHSHGSVRLLKIRRGDYKAAMRAAQVEAMSGSRSVAGSRHAAAGDSPDLSATVSPHGVSRKSSQVGLGSGSVVVNIPRSSTPPPKVP